MTKEDGKFAAKNFLEAHRGQATRINEILEKWYVHVVGPVSDFQPVHLNFSIQVIMNFTETDSPDMYLYSKPIAHIKPELLTILRNDIRGEQIGSMSEKFSEWTKNHLWGEHASVTKANIIRTASYHVGFWMSKIGDSYHDDTRIWDVVDDGLTSGVTAFEPLAELAENALITSLQAATLEQFISDTWVQPSELETTNQ